MVQYTSRLRLGDCIARRFAPPPPPSQVLDGTGWPIPTQLIPLWQRAGEVQEMLTALSRVKGALRSAQENRDKLFAEVNFSSALSQLDQALDGHQDGEAVCGVPDVPGPASRQVHAVPWPGLISEHRWNTCVTREDKEFRRESERETKAETGNMKGAP